MLAQKTNGRILFKLGLALLVVAALAAAIFYRLQGTARVKVVKRDAAVDAVTGTVTVDAAEGGTKELKSEAAGKVAWCEPLGPGASFKEKDRLLELDATELNRTIEQTKRKYTEDKQRAQLALTGGKPELLAHAAELGDADREKLFRDINPVRKVAKDKLDQAERLRGLGSVSDEEVNTAQRALDAIDLDLKFKALEEKQKEADYNATMASLEDQLKRMTILAPADGQIDTAFAWKGMLLGSGQTVATWFSNTRTVAAKISEESFGKVKLGQTARLRLLTYGQREFEATVSKLLPKADETQRFTVFLDVKVDPAQIPELLKPNSTGEVTITVDVRPDQPMISRRAIFDGDKVFVVKNGRVQKKQVKVGYVSLTVVEIREGLAIGDQVIVDSLEDFRDGQRVRVEVVN